MENSFIQAAYRGENKVWQYLVGIIIIIIMIVILGLLPLLLLNVGPENVETMGETALGYSLMLFPFVAGLLGIGLAIRLHGRSFQSLITPLKKINWRKVGFGAGLWFLLTCIFELIAYAQNPSIYELTFDFSKFLPFFIASILLIPLQTSFEEILFRGYLIQGFGVAFRRPWIALVLTSFIFGALHFWNPEIQEYGSWIITSYISIGVTLGLITLWDESLELALGLHAANNLYASIFVTFPSSALATPTVISVLEFDAVLMSIFGIIGQVLFIIICAKVYKWKSFEKIFWKIERPENSVDLVPDTSYEEDIIPEI